MTLDAQDEEEEAILDFYLIEMSQAGNARMEKGITCDKAPCMIQSGRKVGKLVHIRPGDTARSSPQQLGPGQQLESPQPLR